MKCSKTNLSKKYIQNCLERPLPWPYKRGLSRQVVFGDRFNYIELQDLLPGIAGLSRQLVSHGSGLSRQVSQYTPKVLLQVSYDA